QAQQVEEELHRSPRDDREAWGGFGALGALYRLRAWAEHAFLPRGTRRVPTGVPAQDLERLQLLRDLREHRRLEPAGHATAARQSPQHGPVDPGGARPDG